MIVVVGLWELKLQEEMNDIFSSTPSTVYRRYNGYIATLEE
jgi:hypothetical protein